MLYLHKALVDLCAVCLALVFVGELNFGVFEHFFVHVLETCVLFSHLSHRYFNVHFYLKLTLWDGLGQFDCAFVGVEGRRLHFKLIAYLVNAKSLSGHTCIHF